MAASVDQKLRAQTKFPAEFNQKVDMQKINVEVMKKWIAGKITELLGNEDDIVIELCFNLLEGTRFPDIKDLQISLTGFLDKDAPKFCKELWNLCLSAQSNPQGVPKELLEAKKLELMQEKVDAEKAAQDSKARLDLEQARDTEMNDLRQRDRVSRGGERGRGRGRGRGGRGGYDSPRFRDSSRSPRRRSPYRNGPSGRREVDTYVPGGRGRGNERNGRGRNRSSSSVRSISRSPPRRRRGRSTRSSTRSRSKTPPPYEPSSQNPAREENEKQESTKSASRLDGSRSRSPQRRRRHSSRSPSRSRSRSPPRRRQRHRSPSTSISRSRSRSRDRQRGHGRGGGSRRYRSPSWSTHNRDHRRADIARPTRDDRRLSRSSSPNRSQSRSRSRSRSRRRDNKRRRSLQRWDPPNRRRRNTSSVSSTRSPDQKRTRRDRSPGGADERNGTPIDANGSD